MCMSDYRWLLQNVTISNCSNITNSHTLYNSLQHALSLFNLLCLHRSLSGNGFQCRSFPSSHVHVLTGRQLSPNSTGLHSTVLNCTALTNWTELGQSSHIALEWTHREHCLQHLFYCCVTSPRTWQVPLFCVYEPLPNNRSTCYIAPSLRLQAYRHFFFPEGCACDVCDWPRIPSSWLGSHDDYSPTAPTAPSLRPLISSSSLIRCKLFQAYHHQPRSRVVLLTSLLSFQRGLTPPWCPDTHFSNLDGNPHCSLHDLQFMRLSEGLI
jgi:hypothetical protein